ncbi:MAG: acetylglutamate kinase, partial [Actinomycetota bacterium]|nr:acetylglutamate kinase [Actinomycetota bacterium]
MTLGAHAKAEILFEALPYLRAWSGRTVVVKLGGQALADPTLSSLVAQDIALLTLVGIRVAIVHGGGPQVTAAMAAADIEARFVDGLRVTDDATVEIVRAVLVGTINAQLVQQLNSAGASAVGLHGGDGGLVVVRARAPELGRVGDVDRVDPAVVRTLLDEGYTPVIAPVAPDADGVTHNVNADAVAGAIAAALDAEKLVFLTNVAGLYRD